MDENSQKIKIIIGERIREIRKPKMTQKTLAEITGLSEKYISRVEHGDENSTLDTLLRITSALNISIEELFKGVQQGKGESGLIINQIISVLQTRNEEELKLILDMINLLLCWRR